MMALGFEQVDDLLESHKVEINRSGPNAAAAVAIDHPGYQLYPLLAREQGPEFATLTVAAALVPNRMMGDEDDEVDENGASTETEC
jgi:hypothetical protein